MFFIGIITNQKNERYVKNELSQENILFINDKTIANMKNIKFDAIVIDNKINNRNNLRKILSNTKYVILNSDIEIDLEVIKGLDTGY